jgi:hypothetical protein
MTSADTSAIESALQLKLPARFKEFMVEHAAKLKRARSTLVGQVVLETSPAAIVKLNKQLRRDGIETGDADGEAKPAPWPAEYLALSDNGAGDHLCIRTTETSGALHEFDGEEGRFSRAFRSLDAYLADVNKRLAKLAASPKGKSDKALLKRAPALHADWSGLNVPIPDLEPPATLKRVKAFGVDVERLKSDYAALLEAVTGIPRSKWSIAARSSEQRLVRLVHSTKAKPPRPYKFSGFQMPFGEMRLSLQLNDPKATLDASVIDWAAFHQAVAGLYSNVLRTPVGMPPGKMKVSKPTVYGYVGIEWTYAMIRA